MKLGVIMPVVLQNVTLLEMTLETTRNLWVDAAWAEGHDLDITFHVLCNRLHVCSELELRDKLWECWRQPSHIEVINDFERSVAGAWNYGVCQALLQRRDHFLIVANDARPKLGTIEALLEFGDDPSNRNVAVWSGAATATSGPGSSDGCDFSLFCIRLGTIAETGWFDENYRPAYFEDNDYYARVVLGGKECRYVHNAPFDHLGSQTIRHDAEMAHHVRHWFGINRDYFARKWGVNQPAGDAAGVRAKYYATPFNSGRKLSYWERPR
jgi:hypothetical protein